MDDLLAINGGKPVREKMLPYGRQTIEEDDIQAVTDTLRSDWLTTGPKVTEFEEKFAKEVDAKYAVAVSNGTAALHIAMLAANIKKGSEVITTPISFVATANAARYVGADVKFVDICKTSYNINAELISQQITPNTKAIVAVDYTGQPAEWDRINAIAKQHHLLTIADAAHALGATYRNKKVGSLADMTTFSLHPVKHITTGEGGVVTTNNNELANRLRLFRNHGIASDHRQREKTGAWYYDMSDLGFNYRLTDIQSALGISQLKKLNTWIEKRQVIATKYNQAFSLMPEVIIPQVANDRTSAWHLYVLQFRQDKLRANRDQIFRALRAENIGVNVHYIPIPWHSYYQALGYKKGGWPVSEAMHEQIISLPIWPGMTERDVADTIEAVSKVIEAYKQ